MEENKLEYLKKKKAEFQESIKMKSKQQTLDHALSELQRTFQVKITTLSFPFSEIVSPVKIDLPELPPYKKYINDSNKVEKEIIIDLKNWFVEQKSKTFLLTNCHLINLDDWLEVDSSSLLQNFNSAIEAFDLFHNLIFCDSSKNFLNIFEFENEIIVYKGTISGMEIKYYC